MTFLPSWPSSAHFRAIYSEHSNDFECDKPDERDYAIFIYQDRGQSKFVCICVIFPYIVSCSSHLDVSLLLLFVCSFFVLSMIYLNNWIDAHFWFGRMARFEEEDDNEKRCIIHKCTCSVRFSFYCCTHNALRCPFCEWKMKFRILSSTRRAIKTSQNWLNKILNWAFCCDFLCVVSDGGKNKQWEHKWRRDIAFPDIQSFKHMVNIFPYYFSLLSLSATLQVSRKNETSSPKRQRCILLSSWHVAFKKVFLSSLKVHVRHYGGTPKSWCHKTSKVTFTNNFRRRCIWWRAATQIH